MEQKLSHFGRAVNTPAEEQDDGNDYPYWDGWPVYEALPLPSGLQVQAEWWELACQDDDRATTQVPLGLVNAGSIELPGLPPVAVALTRRLFDGYYNASEWESAEHFACGYGPTVITDYDRRLGAIVAPLIGVCPWVPTALCYQVYLPGLYTYPEYADHQHFPARLFAVVGNRDDGVPFAVVSYHDEPLLILPLRRNGRLTVAGFGRLVVSEQRG
jgi:hypothetical protein